MLLEASEWMKIRSFASFLKQYSQTNIRISDKRERDQINKGNAYGTNKMKEKALTVIFE